MDTVLSGLVVPFPLYPTGLELLVYGASTASSRPAVKSDIGDGWGQSGDRDDARESTAVRGKNKAQSVGKRATAGRSRVRLIY